MIRKTSWGQNYRSLEYIKINFRLFSDRARTFRFNCKIPYQKWNILFSTKSMQDMSIMSRNKIFRVEKVYKLALNNFFMRVISFYSFICNYIFCSLIQNIIKNKKTLLSKTLRRIWKKYWGQNNHLKKMHKFIAEHFLFGYVVFFLIVKNVIKNEKFYFVPNLCELRKKF